MLSLCTRRSSGLLAMSLLQSNKYGCFVPHLMTKHLSQLTIKATRRSFLSKQVLNQSKDVIHAQIRKPSDLVLKLKQEGRCPGVILPYSKKKEEEVDVVLSGKAMKTRSLKTQYPLERVWVRAAGKQYMCVLELVKFNIKNFIEKVYFREYVPGQPNHLTIPVKLTHLELNKFFHAGFGIITNVEEVDIICYNVQYPTRFNIDVSYVNPDRPYRVGDLANTFPPGIILNPKVDPNKTLFELEVPETAGTAQEMTAEAILANINYGKDKKTDAKPAAGGSTPAAGKGDAAKGDAGKSASAAKTEAKAAPAKKK